MGADQQDPVKRLGRPPLPPEDRLDAELKFKVTTRMADDLYRLAFRHRHQDMSAFCREVFARLLRDQATLRRLLEDERGGPIEPPPAAGGGTWGR